MTRLGEVLPFGRLFTLGSFLIAVVGSPHFRYFFHVEGYAVCNVDENILGYILSDFFHKPSFWSPCNEHTVSFFLFPHLNKGIHRSVQSV
jgi:hypothetical protein